MSNVGIQNETDSRAHSFNTYKTFVPCEPVSQLDRVPYSLVFKLPDEKHHLEKMSIQTPAFKGY